jgi:hypothetical protein
MSSSSRRRESRICPRNFQEETSTEYVRYTAVSLGLDTDIILAILQDMFSVIWDPRLLPKKMAKAFDPNPPTPKTVDTEITPRDLQDYLIAFMKNDNLGSIANAHLAQADRYGPSHPNCLRLCTCLKVADMSYDRD